MGVPGRTTEGRSVTVTKTSGSPNITGAAGTFSTEDTGRTITGTGIPAGATLAAVPSDTAATLSANATAAGSGAATLGPAVDSAAGYRGWSPETPAEAATYTVAAVNAGKVQPDRAVDGSTGRTQRGR